jgi:transcriptional regulator GlxA family with amidase domain
MILVKWRNFMFAEKIIRMIAILGISAVAAVAQSASAQKSTAAVANLSTGNEIQIRAIKPPEKGSINVAFVVSKNTDLMDVAGPWEAFGGAMFDSHGKVWHGGDDMIMPFNTYTVSDTKNPVDAGGLRIIPDYTFADAPKPQVIVIPAQGGRSEDQRRWLEANSPTADVTMSVCTGASVLAGYGMLDGLTATTHHMSLQKMQKDFPKVHFVSGTRYVEHDKISTAGGLTSGIDLALHVIERYYGREMAESVADYLEYHSDLWKNPNFADVKMVTAAK